MTALIRVPVGHSFRVLDAIVIKRSKLGPWPSLIGVFFAFLHCGFSRDFNSVNSTNNLNNY